ncbi:g5056 [Coccomyxa elongata]
MEHLTPPTLHPSGSQQVHPQNWDLKVSTNLQTRLLLVQNPQSTIRSLQDAIEEDHLAIYPAQGPVKCSTVCAVDYNAAGAERYYPINSKYLLRDALKRDGAEVFAYVELKQKKRSLGSHATPDLLSGAPGQKRPRAAAAASSPSPLPRAQLEAEVCSGSSDFTGEVEGDTETGMTRKAARAKQRKKKLKGKQRAAATGQKAVTYGEKEIGGSQEIQRSLQPQKGAAETGATEAPAGKSGKRKRGRSQVGAAEAEGAGARQVPQEADEDLAEGTGADSRQLRQAADAAEPAEARSPEQGRRKRRRNNRHGSGADSLFLESNDDRDAPSRPRETAPQSSSGPVAAAAATPGKGGLTATVVDRNILHELDMEGRPRTRASLRSSGAHGRPAAKDISHFSPAGGSGGEGGTASGMAVAGRAEVTISNAAEPAPLSSRRSSGGGLHAAAGTAKNDDSESSSEEDGGDPTKAATAPGQTAENASGAPDQAAGRASSQSSGSTSESESDSDDEEAPAQHTRSQQPWRQAAQLLLHLGSSFSGAADSPSKRGPVQTSAPAAQKCSHGAEPRPAAASGDAAEKLALPPAEPQSSSSSEDDSSDESSDSDDEGRPQGGNATGARKQEAPEQVPPKQDALDESSYGGESEPGVKEDSSHGGESDPGSKEEADVKEDEGPEDVKSESEEEAVVKQEGYSEGQAEASSEDESSKDDDPSEEEESGGEEEQESEEEQWGDEESGGSDGMGSPEGETDGASPTAAEGEGGSSRNMALEDTDFDRLKNEATQKVLDTLADMPDAISMLLAAKSARKKARQNGGAAAAAEPARQEAPSTPVPSDARLASLGEALIRQKESQEQATQNNAAALPLPGHPELKPLAEYKGESDLRSALRAALVSLVNHQQGTNHKFAVQVLRECPKPAWWPLERWDKNQLDRRWKALETIYHAIQKQRRSLIGSASSA